MYWYESYFLSYCPVACVSAFFILTTKPSGNAGREAYLYWVKTTCFHVSHWFLLLVLNISVVKQFLFIATLTTKIITLMYTLKMLAPWLYWPSHFWVSPDEMTICPPLLQCLRVLTYMNKISFTLALVVVTRHALVSQMIYFLLSLSLNFKSFGPILNFNSFGFIAVVLSFNHTTRLILLCWVFRISHLSFFFSILLSCGNTPQPNWHVYMLARRAAELQSPDNFSLHIFHTDRLCTAKLRFKYCNKNAHILGEKFYQRACNSMYRLYPGVKTIISVLLQRPSFKCPLSFLRMTTFSSVLHYILS